MKSLLFWLSGFVLGYVARSVVLLWQRRKDNHSLSFVHLTPELRRERSRARIRNAINRQIEDAVDPDFDADSSSYARRG